MATWGLFLFKRLGKSGAGFSEKHGTFLTLPVQIKDAFRIWFRPGGISGL
jgi:hypothetical protein